ncbi:Sorting nexin-33 [Lamellibrachia satsuma]|nr:Sorting nexin-33 [Lamellibrachia satsuma]
MAAHTYGLKMAELQARALFEFSSGAEGELSFGDAEILTITRQDIGEGWWEAVNSRGETGLVPEAYLEITSFPEPNIPPPPPPAMVIQSSQSWNRPQQPDIAEQKKVPPSRPWQPPAKPAQTNHNDRDAITKQESYEDWDDDDWDDDDDDDDSSVNTETSDPHRGGNSKSQASRHRTGSTSSDAHKYGTVRKFGRFSGFAKQGGEAYLFDTTLIPPVDPSLIITIMETADGPCWQPAAEAYSCEIKSPKKESKYHGMKSFIAYQLTPTFSNIQVSRRYKHFDWLHDRLEEKFTTMAIPPLPDKQVTGRYEDDFISQRMQQLRQWIERMCQHPVVSQSEVFKHFMSITEEKKWKAGKRRAEKDEYRGVKFFLTVASPSTSPDPKLLELQMDRFSRFIKSMDDSVRQVSTVGEQNIKRRRGPFRKDFQKLGGSLVCLAKSFEFDERPASQSLTRAIEQTGSAYEDIAQMIQEQPTVDMYPFLEGLHEYKGLLSTFPEILSVHRTATQKIQEQGGRLEDADMSTAQARADVIAYATLAEMNHFQQCRVTDFKYMMQHYLREQINFYQQVTQKLQSALQQYDDA